MKRRKNKLKFCQSCQRYTVVNKDRLCERCVKSPRRQQNSPLETIKRLIRKIAWGADRVSKDRNENWRSRVYQPFEEDGSITSEEWLALRDSVLRRDHFKCKRCNQRYKRNKLNAHHIIPRSEGGANDKSNLITLCIPCHDIVEIRGFRTKAAIIGSYDAPKGQHESEEEKEPERVLKDRPSDWRTWVYGGSRKPAKK